MSSVPNEPEPSKPGRKAVIRRFARRFYFCVVAGALAWIAFCTFIVGDVTWWSEMVAIWPPVFWAVALMVPALGVFDRRRPGRFVVMVVLVAAYILAAEEWRHWARGSGGMTPRPAGGLRVVTWNCGGGWGSNEQLLTYLAEWEPDVCFLQESPEGEGFFKEGELVGWFEGWHAVSAGDVALLSRYPVRTLTEEAVG